MRTADNLPPGCTADIVSTKHHPDQTVAIYQVTIDVSQLPESPDGCVIPFVVRGDTEHHIDVPIIRVDPLRQ